MARTDAHAGPHDGLRVLVAHEWLVAWAGSERVVEQILTAFPEADVVVGVRRPDVADGHRLTTRARETWLGRVPGARAHHRWFLPLQGLAFASLDTSAYDLVISSSHAFSKMVRARPGAVHLCYCHSPPRYLWDLRDAYRRGAGPLQRAALAVSSPALRRWDRHAAGRVDHFLANSRFVASRVRRAYGRRATVVYPPVSSKGGVAPGPRGDFLLSLGRLVPYKRVDLAIAAAERLGRRLIVAGDGPDRPRLERLAGRHTEFAGAVSEAEAGRLLATCAAFVFCAEEDFGIAPVEANAHGAPVVAYRAGGVCESMADGVTAEFFDRQEVDDVAAALTRALTRSWGGEALVANAARFSADVFRARFRAAVEAAVRRYGGMAGDESRRALIAAEAAARLTVARGDA